MIIEHFLSWMQTASVPKRTQATSALARAFLHSKMSYDERITAESALTLLLEDSSSTVRFALADAIASSKNAPRHIIMGLATDAAEIATIVLSRSPIFTTGELVDLVASGTVEQQIAIACRGQINTALCGAIAEVGVVEACLGMLMNKAASYSRRIIQRIVERHGNNVEVRKLLLKDGSLDAEFRNKLLEKLGDNLSNFVSRKNWIPKPRIQRSIRDTLDRSSILFASKSEDKQVVDLVESLIESGRLTTGYLLRAICMGNITLFCKAMSRLTLIPAERIESMISQDGHTAFRAAFAKSGMPVEAFEVFSTALNVWQGLLMEPEWTSRARMPYLVTRQLVGNYQAKQNDVVDELLVLLRRISNDLARDEAKTHIIALATKRESEREEKIDADEESLAQNATSPEQLKAEEIRLIDEQFVREIEDSIFQSLERDVIEISDNDMSIPVNAANDTPIERNSEKVIEVPHRSLLSNAA
ncbi:MAG: DUF2336 domain-containing protein [Bacteroidetes bacterium]|nr:DUF2336 domain-containing protein [Bacteroidota bacterium]